MIDLDKQLLTAEQYTQLTPFEQGFASYWQGYYNPDIPQLCIYAKGSAEAAKWAAGQNQAVIAAIDSEE